MGVAGGEIRGEFRIKAGVREFIKIMESRHEEYSPIETGIWANDSTDE
jgi:hypothetical protein